MDAVGEDGVFSLDAEILEMGDDALAAVVPARDLHNRRRLRHMRAYADGVVVGEPPNLPHEVG